LIQVSLPFTYTVGTSPINNATWSLQVWKSGSGGETLLQNGKDIQYFVAGDPISSTLYFTYYTSGDFYFTLSEAIPSTNIVISSAFVTGYSGNTCNVSSEDDNINAGNSLTITAGTTSGNVTGNTPMGMSTTNYIKGSYLVINGQYATNGSVLTIGGTQLTVVVDNNCDYYAN
jgi:hypothetical protein